MAKAVFIQNPVSIYDDRPGEAYHFPKRYLGMVRETVGDWVVLYEGRKGALGYVAVQRVDRVVPDPMQSDHYFAMFDRASLWGFETIVPRSDDAGRAFEASLRGRDGRAMAGGAAVSAVRRLTEAEFAAIVSYGMRSAAGPEALSRDPADDNNHGVAPVNYAFADAATPFQPAPLAGFRADILTNRKARDRSFERQVKRAYGGRCAISGLALRNGGGRPEVQAAHIRPVSAHGPDIVPNGLALSGTLHWMFDRGLVAVADDLTILVSRNKVSPEIADRLIAPGQKLILPPDPRDHPHPEYLRYHREEIYGRAA
ncbi:HNH endonuclease [uncultured Maritimibacter sp.]|uniref:HNH endonuclease n=1 Tax=uncultured Maritimibacter sp. TaxID=991866 RepID=UPI000A963E08|nr:HNH endonuclease [uncultured Maritimibacter sp.]